MPRLTHADQACRKRAAELSPDNPHETARQLARGWTDEVWQGRDRAQRLAHAIHLDLGDRTKSMARTRKAIRELAKIAANIKTWEQYAKAYKRYADER